GHHLERLGVYDRDVVFVLDVDVNAALSVGGGLLGRTAQVERADDRSVAGLDDGRIRRVVAEHPHTSVERIEQDTVRTALDVDRLNHRQRLGVPHRDGLTAGEAVARFRIHGDAARVYVGDLASGLERVEIEDG